MYKFSHECKKDVLNSFNKGRGLGATLRHLKKMKKNENSTTIGIFRFTIKTLQRKNNYFSKKKVRYHFNSFVDVDDYFQNEKYEIFKDLYDS